MNCPHMSAEDQHTFLLLRLGFMEGLALAAIDTLWREGKEGAAAALDQRLKEFNARFPHPLSVNVQPASTDAPK